MTVNNKQQINILILLLTGATLVSLYWILRYNGYAMEGDATRLTLAAEGIQKEGTLTDNSYVYSNGYGYSAQLAIISTITGISIQSIQLNAGLWLIILILIAFITYRELLQSFKLGVFSCLILLVQPDFIFYILRSSHEKITWSYALLLLFFFARTYKLLEKEKRWAIYIFLFYLILWAMISSNVFLAANFVMALALSFVIGNLITSRLLRKKASISEGERVFLKRFFYTAVIGNILIFLFIVYVYSPASVYYETLGSFVDKVSVLFLGQPEDSIQQSYVQPYGVVGTAWVSLTYYFLLTTIQWLLMLTSVGVWAFSVINVLRKGFLFLTQQQRLLLFVYTGFATQLALGVGADFLGVVASNSQVRLFTPFALLASPLTASGITALLSLVRKSFRTVIITFLTLFFIYAQSAALLKATNEPSFSNLWLFSPPDYRSASDWIDRNSKDSEVWLDISPHQLDVMTFYRGYNWQTTNRYTTNSFEANIKFIVLSTTTFYQAQRQGIPLPNVTGYHRIYDNGATAIYHRRPRTPYQS